MNHLEEWKLIKKWYEDEYEQTPEIKYRIERIDELIKSQEINNNKINHFK